MNLITLILSIAILFGLTDFVTERYPRLQRDLWYVAWFIVAFLFTIKYYYGADICTYVPFYENLPSPHYLWHNRGNIDLEFEFGYSLFCSILHSWGISFYWHTVIVSVFYFVVIAALFTRIERKRAFALAILVVLDYNCIFATYRQCLAVACFVLMVLCWQDKRYLWAIVLAVLTASFHKSGAFVVGIVLLYYFVRSRWAQPYIYQLMLIVLLMVFLLPIAHISSVFIEHLPLPESYLTSLENHLALGRQIQVVIIPYMAVLLLIASYNRYRRSRMESIAAVALVGLIFVVVLYQYYHLLWRIRSYFLPLMIVYGFQLVQQIEDEKIYVPYGRLLKQVTCVIIFLYLGHYTYLCQRSSKEAKHDIYAACTVFDLIHHRPEVVQDRQMKKAEMWWKEDHERDTQNQIKK